MKLRVKLLTPRCDLQSFTLHGVILRTLPDGLILRTTGEYNGKPKFSKDPSGPPYLWWSGDGLPFSHPMPAGAYYCVRDDGNQGFDFTGLYGPAPDVLPNPPDQNSCIIYKRMDALKPQAWLRAVVQNSPCSDNFWQLVRVVDATVTLISEGRGSGGLPYIGHYGPGPHNDLPWVYAWELSAIPANAWILSEYPNAEVMNTKFTGGPYTPWFGVLQNTDPVGEYSDSLSGCWNCRFTLESYRYPSPKCYRVWKDRDFEPSVDLSGDYLLGDPPEYYPEDDDNDYPVYRKGDSAIYRLDDRWWIGPTVGVAEGYHTKDYWHGYRTPLTPLKCVGDSPPEYTGAHWITHCADGFWWPFCG